MFYRYQELYDMLYVEPIDESEKDLALDDISMMTDQDWCGWIEYREHRRDSRDYI